MAGHGQSLPAPRVPAARIDHTMPDTTAILGVLSDAMALCGTVAAPRGTAPEPKVPAQRRRIVVNLRTAGASRSSAPVPAGLRLSGQMQARRREARVEAPTRAIVPVYGSERFYAHGSAAATAARRADARQERRRHPLLQMFLIWLLLGWVGGHQRYAGRRRFANCYVLVAVITSGLMLQGQDLPMRLYVLALLIDGALLPITAPSSRR